MLQRSPGLPERILAVARAYATVHGHLLPPTGAVVGGNIPHGVRMKNQRAAPKKAAASSQLRILKRSLDPLAGAPPGQ